MAPYGSDEKTSTIPLGQIATCIMGKHQWLEMQESEAAKPMHLTTVKTCRACTVNDTAVCRSCEACFNQGTSTSNILAPVWPRMTIMRGTQTRSLTWNVSLYPGRFFSDGRPKLVFQKQHKIQKALEATRLK
jgi:hypothetical protein